MDYNSIRRVSREICVGRVTVGGKSPVSIQSMTNTDTSDVEATYNQILALEAAGCDIVRLAVPTLEAADTFRVLKARGVRIPLVADIHFDYKIAIAAARAGADKIRINPGNIGSKERIKAVTDVCLEYGLPIRIGVNSGSLERDILAKYGKPTAEALAESALYHAGLLWDLCFSDIALSVKASNVSDTILANRILASKTDLPLHLGVTEAGAGEMGIIKSSVGIGALLAEGIGDTLRVSLTDDPVKEIYAAREMLRVLGMRENGGMDIVSCPTCGRTKISLISLSEEFKRRVRESGLDSKNIKVALMGCAVNGPGEAREADIGIAGGNGEGLLFKKGEIVRKIPEDRLIDELIDEIKKM